MNITPVIASFDDVIITHELEARSAPPRNIRTEHAAMLGLARQAATDPSGLLQRLVDVAMELCSAGTAGLSLLEPGAPGRGVFRWVALAGAYQGNVGGTTPEGFSPCGTCLERGSAQLYAYPARVFDYLAVAAPPIVEALVIPLRSFLGPLGTIWIVSHTEARRFTTADVEVMTTLGDFTSAALALQRARAAAEAANRAKDELLAVVSHELRSPLTGIIGWSELLLAGRANASEAARAITAIHNHALRQGAMVEDLLDASRAVLGTLRLDEGAMDLTEVVQSAVHAVAAPARARGVEIDSDLDGPLLFHGDPARVLQVVGNVLNNAVKFSRRGDRVSVCLRDKSSAVEIVVRDTGTGISPDVLPFVFEAFRQADSSSTRRERGLGLGLSIARQLVELHGGSIEARSDGLGLGAVFTIRLPATRRLLQMPAAAAPAGAREDRRLDETAVLIVDDEPDVREMLACVLQDAGAITTTAGSAAEALDFLARQRFDVVLADIGMPDEDGYSLAAKLRIHGAACAPRLLIAVTAYTVERDRHRALAAGFDHYFPKPVDVDRLLSAIVTSLPIAKQ